MKRGLLRVLMLAGLWGCGHPPAAGLPVSHAGQASGVVPDNALELRLDALTQSLEEQGFSRGPFEARGFLAPSARATQAVSVAAGTCAMFVAVATPSVIDLDASLYRPDGSALVEDEGADARPSLTLCAGEHPVSAYYALHAYQGVGAFVAAQFERPLRAGDDLITASDLEVVSELSDLAKALHKRGFEDAAPRVDVELAQQSPVRVAVHVNAGDCYTLAAEAQAGLSALGLRLVDGTGRELAHGVGDVGLASLQYCADQTSDYSLEVRAGGGRGTARIARFRASHAAVGGAHSMWLGEPSPSSAAWQERRPAEPSQNQLRARGEPPLLYEQRALGQGQVIEIDVTRTPQACERWEAQLSPGLSRATLRIESIDGKPLAEAESRNMRAQLELCERRGPARVVLIGRAGYGQVTLIGTRIRAPGES